MVEKRLEENRLEVKRIASKIMLEYANFLSHDDIDMWLVFVITKDTFYDYESSVAYFKNRYDAEQWFSSKTNNGELPYYGYCCDEKIWNKIDELLS